MSSPDDPWDENVRTTEQMQEEEQQRQEEERRRELMILREQEHPDWWTLEDLMTVPLEKSVGFLANEMFIPGTINSIYGPSHSYKSWLVLFAMLQYATGSVIGTLVTRQAKTLLFSQELNRRALAKRVVSLLSLKEGRDVGRQTAIREREPFDFYHRTKQSQALLERDITKTNSPDIVFFDSLAQLHTGDENSNRDMGIVLNAVLEVLVNHGKVGVFIHHKSGKGGDAAFGRSDIASARGATVIGDICRDMVMVSSLKPVDGRPRSQVRVTKASELSDPSAVKPFTFSVENHPNFKGRMIFTFEEGDAAKQETPAILANVEQLREIVGEMAGDGEVLRKALVDHLVELSWSRRRVDETISAALHGGKIARKKDGTSSAFYLPRGIKENDGVDKG